MVFEIFNDIFCACEATVKEENGFLFSVGENFTGELIGSQTEHLDPLVMALIGLVSYLLVAINPPEDGDCPVSEGDCCDDGFQPTV